jgi:tetratricopeptide (TPR) repeat protein
MAKKLPPLVFCLLVGAALAWVGAQAPETAGSQAEAALAGARQRLAAGSLPEAQAELDAYLAAWPAAPGREEALFLRGRVLSQLGEGEASIQALQSFLSSYPASTYAAAAWYWIAESLYGLGRLDEAEAACQKLLRDWPTSARAEAAQYRLSLIRLERRGQELSRLLRWSHEEILRNVEERQRREGALQQKIDGLQRQLAAAQSTPAPAAAAEPAAAAGPAASADDEGIRRLLEAKQAALLLKEQLLDWLQRGGEWQR